MRPRGPTNPAKTSITQNITIVCPFVVSSSKKCPALNTQKNGETSASIKGKKIHWVVGIEGTRVPLVKQKGLRKTSDTKTFVRETNRTVGGGGVHVFTEGGCVKRLGSTERKRNFGWCKRRNTKNKRKPQRARWWNQEENQRKKGK